MKRYDEKILNRLIDRYESSLLYTRKNQVQISIAYPVKRSTLPEYFEEASLQFDTIHEQLEALEQKGYIRLVWKGGRQGHILEKCVLVPEQADSIYAFLRRRPKREKETEILEICREYQGKAEELDAFLLWIMERLQTGQSIRQYADLDRPQEFERLCQLIWHIVKNSGECFLRQFSIRWFHDSKIAEAEIGKAVHIIARFYKDDSLTELETDEVLEEFNIFRNPSWIMIKGTACFGRMPDERQEAYELQPADHDSQEPGGQPVWIELAAFPEGLGIAGSDAGRLVWSREIQPSVIFTIENLTSFHQWKITGRENQSILCIYLGGYANRTKRDFLQRVYEAYPAAQYFHFGDMDCGGFRIWKDICCKTGIPFAAYHMNRETYLQYLEYGRELSAQDRKTLARMQQDPFFEGQQELFRLMLKEGKKLEQECVVCV